MKPLVQEKERAIALRKKGLSYRDILTEVNVAKSSLSLWLKDLPLTKNEKYALKNRKDANISHGRIKLAGILSQRRLEREAVWFKEAQIDFHKNISNSLFQVGITLYWAEGTKRSNQWNFINSDEDMLNIMLDWLDHFSKYSRKNIRVRLYMHKLYAHESCEAWWQKQLSVPASQFSRTVYKPSGKGIKKRPQYKGCLRIDVPKSKELLIKMKFWQNMLIEHCAKQ